MKPAKRIILAITGATGMLYLEPLLNLLGEQKVLVDAVISDAGSQVLRLELGKQATDLPHIERWFACDDFTAPMASGSSLYDAMIILPCTTGTLGAIAAGYSGNLIHRAADVSLKERRPLLLAVRETPLNKTHLANMLRVHEAGAIIFPPMPSFYQKPRDLEEMARNLAGRLCDQINIHVPDMKRWRG
ncbi:MAG: UbiX family flavin prenyltransferase [Desulfobulbaceae bacterium]